MSFSDYLLYSLLGIAVVFFALVLLMIIIKVLTFKKAAPVEEAAPQEERVLPPAKGTAGDILLYDTDDKTAAMLMAIVADEMQTPINELRFKSIREVKDK